jgi:hypothetical protein
VTRRSHLLRSRETRCKSFAGLRRKRGRPDPNRRRQSGAVRGLRAGLGDSRSAGLEPMSGVGLASQGERAGPALQTHSLAGRAVGCRRRDPRLGTAIRPCLRCGVRRNPHRGELEWRRAAGNHGGSFDLRRARRARRCQGEVRRPRPAHLGRRWRGRRDRRGCRRPEIGPSGDGPQSREGTRSRARIA